VLDAALDHVPIREHSKMLAPATPARRCQESPASLEPALPRLSGHIRGTVNHLFMDLMQLKAKSKNWERSDV
jgi:hypothetical protein